MRCGKDALSKTKHQLIVRIPRILWIRPIVVEPQTIGIAVKVENVEIAVPVSEISSAPSVSLPM
jgi:hypothetical protein